VKQRYFYFGIGFLVLVVALVFFNGNRTGITGSVVLEDPAIIDLAGDPNKLTIYFFWGEGCPHCMSQKPYLEELEEKYGDQIEIKSYETWKSPDNVELFKIVAQAHGIQARGVPTTFIGEKNWVGFSSSMALEMDSYIGDCINNNGCRNLLK
jgi:thiol-disulfide isomerase/thioredoxin